MERAGSIVQRRDQAQSGGLTVGQEDGVATSTRQEFHARIGLALVFFKGERKFAVAGKKPGLSKLLILGYGKSRARSRAEAKKPAERKKQCNCRQARQKEEQQLLPSH